jgi:hypothetical protein
VGAHGQGQRAQRRRRRVTRTVTFLLAAALVAAVLLVATGPPAPIPLTPAATGRTLRGAFHVHTVLSDGALPRSDVAAAAARAGLQFAIFTDHGDGTRDPDPPAYIHGVLCLDGVEISTNDGHYIAVGMPAAPYPLGGDAQAVAEDVARLGGFGVAAHPTSPRAELSWTDWSVPVDALEWLNADSEWRDESHARLLRTFLDYLWRPAGALARLLDRPEGALARWDRLTAERPVVALAGHDAHGGFGAEENDGTGGRRLHLPSYEASFRTFSLYVTTASAPSGGAEADAELLIDAIRAGRVFTAIDAIAGPAALDFSAVAGRSRAEAGDALPLGPAPAQFTVRAGVPAGARTILLRNGEIVAEGSGGALDYHDGAPGAYRVEIHVPGAPGDPPVPWLVSNPIYRLLNSGPPAPDAVGPNVLESTLVRPEDWRVESSAGSSGSVAVSGDEVSLRFSLDSQPGTSPFVALAAPVDGVPENATGIVFSGRASSPMRVSLQLRFANDAGERWGTSAFLDADPRTIRLPVSRLRHVSGSTPRPPLNNATSILLVVDLTNARPGSAGEFTISGVALRQLGR